MNEEKIVIQTEEIETIIDAADIELNIEQQEVVENIEVKTPEEVTIEIEEGFGWVGGDTSRHYSLSGRDEPDQHPVEAITGLRGILDKLSAIKDTVYATKGGFAEFRPWLSGGIYQEEQFYQATGGIGYFVSLVTANGALDGNNVYIDICKKVNNDNTIEVADVYGVTVANSGFCGYKGDTDNQNYAQVCLLGDVKVRVSAEEHQKIELGDYVVPNELGYARKSENNIGFKVISKGSIETTSGATAWYYAEIALVPQNDNIARVVKKIEETKINLDKITIQLGDLSDELGKVQGANIQLGQDFKDLQDLVDESTNKIDTQLPIMTQMLDDAKDVAMKANEAIAQVQLEYAEAVRKANDAQSAVEGALSDVAELQKNIEPLATWAGLYECVLQNDVNQGTQCYFEINDTIYGFTIPVDVSKDGKLQYNVEASTVTVGNQTIEVTEVEDTTGLTLIEPFKPMGNQSVAGFLARADKDHTELSSLTSAFGENGSDLTAIIQKIDENGAAIQHLVTHVDKYILGEQSPAYGLTLEQTSFIQPGTIYVPTKEGIKETYTYKDGEVERAVEQPFDYGQSYIWAATENKPYEYMWKEDKLVYLTAPFTIEEGKIKLTEEINNETLWYCWQGFLVGDKYLYDPGVLYCWNEQKTIWVPVASIGDSATSIGSVNQTAKKLQVAYTDLKGNIASLEVKVDEVSSTVKNEVQEQISSINQTAAEIMMGVYDADDGNATSLGLLLDGMTSTATKVHIVKVKEVLETPPAGEKYKNAPMWNGTEFVFAGEPSTDGTYYFDPMGVPPYTYYCEAATGKYYVYGVSNTAMANLNTRVTNTESEVESWTRFQKGQNETMTSINQTSDEAGAAISSMVYGDFRECVEIKLELTDEEKVAISTDRYDKQPKWENKKFVFEGDTTTNGEYCTIDDTSYYKLFYRADEIVGYEKYQMKSSPYAAVVQKVDSDGNAYAGLVAGDDNDMGSIFVESINNQTKAQINADKITLQSGSYGNATCARESLSEGSYYFTIGEKNYAFSCTEAITEQCILTFDIGNEQLYINNQLIDSLVSDSTDGMTKLTFTLPTSSNLTVEANKISQVVNAIGTDGKVTGASLIQSINNSKAETKIKSDYLDINLSEDFTISAKNVKITTEGTTTFADLFTEGTTTIDGSNITTGTITIGDVSVYEPITWDGNTEGLGSFTSKALAPDGTFYKISDQIPPIDSFKSATIVFNSGVKKSVLAVKDHETDEETGEVVAYRVRWTTDSKNDSIVVQSQDGNYYQGLYVPKFNDGTYVAAIEFALLPLSNLFTTDSVSNFTVIDGGQIATGTITAKQIAADALKSTNYDGPDEGDNEIYADEGTFFDLSNGSITSKNFVIDDKKAYFRGTVYADAGEIGGCTIDEKGTLKVTNANISGKISADHLDVGSITIGSVGADDVILGDPTETHIEWTDKNGATIFYDYYTAYKVSDYIIHDINELVGGIITWSNDESHPISLDNIYRDGSDRYDISVWSEDSGGYLPSILVVPEGDEEFDAGIYFAKHETNLGDLHIPDVYVTSLTITTTNSLSTLFTPGTTTINGSKITTGTITADHISASGISADKIKGGTISSSNITMPLYHQGVDDDSDKVTALRFFDTAKWSYAGWLYAASFDVVEDDMKTVKRIVLATQSSDYALKIHSMSNISVGASSNTYIYGDEIFIGSSTMGTTAIKFQIAGKDTYELDIDQAVNAGILTPIS